MWIYKQFQKHICYAPKLKQIFLQRPFYMRRVYSLQYNDLLTGNTKPHTTAKRSFIHEKYSLDSPQKSCPFFSTLNFLIMYSISISVSATNTTNTCHLRFIFLVSVLLFRHEHCVPGILYTSSR